MMPQSPGCLSRGPKPDGFDLAMELLCTIPPAQPVRLRQLAGDFRMPSKDVRKHLADLERKHGWTLLVPGAKDAHVDMARVPPRMKEQIETQAAAYWFDVWGE